MLACALASLVLVLPVVSAADRLPYSGVCDTLVKVISTASDVYYPGTTQYEQGRSHWASSSTQRPACVVEAGTTDDIATILGVFNSTRTPFAVKGGGHTANPGFSSTPGVHISMSRFSEVVYHESSKTATIGAGMIWDQVYLALEPFGVSVVGGRVTGVGVAGFILGGGYSFKTNQYGLAIDTVRAFELVLPTGEVSTVTEASNPDLFFGLKGGGNNFGIVTKFTLQTYNQSMIWGGPVFYDETQFDKVNAAIANFVANVSDPKATILPAYNVLAGIPVVVNMLFYDAPIPPPGIFDEFMAIPYLSADVETSSYSSLVIYRTSGNSTANMRARFQTVAIKDWTLEILDAIANETEFWGPKLLLDLGLFINYTPEPFLSTHLTHTTSPSAFPPDSARLPSVATNPLFIYYSWLSPLSDEVFDDAIRTSAAYLEELVVKQQGQALASAPRYSNYAIYSTPIESMYGENVPRLKALALKYDPNRVMQLAGGFKFV